jgi:glycogen(starch) synthase
LCYEFHMRILMYGWEFPPHNSGGLGIACYGLVKALASEGADVRFVLPRKYPVASVPNATIVFADETNPLSGEEAQKFASGYMTEDQLKFLRSEYPELQYGSSMFDEVLRYAALSPLVALGEQPDVIHAHDWLCYPAGLAAKRATGAPLVVHVHATELDRTGFAQPNQNIYDIERRGMHEADKVVTVSEYTKNVVVHHYGVDPEKVEVLYNGLDEDQLQAGSDIEADMKKLRDAGWNVVMYAGRLTIQKGVDYYLEAARRVLEYRPHTLFVISGSGDMARQIMDRAAYLGIGDKVLFTGWLRGKELARMYQQADLLVMPSVSEPYGLIPLECLVNGTPVLVSKQSGVSEVLQHALRADFWDTEEMANQIIAILDHPTLRDTLGTEGGKEARAQTWSKVAQRCMMVYKKVVQALTPSRV